jgi:hypothetical protein
LATFAQTTSNVRSVTMEKIARTSRSNAAMTLPALAA